MTDEDAFWSVCKGEILVSNSGKKIGIQVDVGVFKTHFLMSFSVLELYLKWIAHCIISAIASERVEGLHSIVDITPMTSSPGFVMVSHFSQLYLIWKTITYLSQVFLKKTNVHLKFRNIRKGALNIHKRK